MTCQKLTGYLTFSQGVSRRAYEQAVCHMTQDFLIRRTKGKLGKSVLATAQLFLNAVILPYLSLLLGPEMVIYMSVCSPYE